MEHMLLKARVETAQDAGVFEAVISTASIDRERDIVDPQGFVRALQKWVPLGKKIPLAWNHSTKAEDQIGYIDPASVRVQGDEVIAAGWIDQSMSVGADAWKQVKRGVAGFSFGYLVPQAGSTPRKGGGRHIRELDVFEVTITPAPMNNDTRVLGWKGIKAAGTVGPAARHHLENLIKYYMSKPHPFTECVHDNTKRFGPDGADKVCATLKDIGTGTTHWRHGGNHGKAVPLDEDMQSMCQALYDAASGDLEALLEMWQEYAHSNGDGDVMPSTGKAAMQALRRRADAEALEFVSGEQRPRSEVERDEMRVEMDELREEVTGYKSRFDEAQAELQKAHEALEAKAVDAKTLRRAADSLALERATDGVRDEMRGELDALRGELDGYKSRLEKSQTALREALDAKSVDAKTLRRAADALTFEQTAGVKADATTPTTEDEDDPAELLGQMMSLAQDFIGDEDDPADVRAMRQVMTLLLQLQGAEAEEDAGKSVKATWSSAYVGNLPDSAFLYIASGGSKDDEGKTTPRSLRYFPVRDANGTVDQDHVRNALARIPQSNLPQNVKDSCTAKARKLLDSSKSAVPAVRTGSSPVDPLRRLADAVALEHASDGESLRKPPRQKVAPKPTPEVPLDELRRRTRDEMLIALSGVEDP